MMNGCTSYSTSQPHKLSFEEKIMIFRPALCAICCVKSVTGGPVTKLSSTVSLQKCGECGSTNVQGYRFIRFLKFSMRNSGADAGYICLSGLGDINEKELTDSKNTLCLTCWIYSNIPLEHSYIVDELKLKRSVCKNCKLAKAAKYVKMFYTSNP